MALKFNKQSLEDFHERLSSVDASWQEDFTLKEIVRKSLKPISKARRYKVSWEKIAQMLQEATAGKLEVSAASVRQYYFELMEKPPKKEAAKPTRTEAGRKRMKLGNIQTDTLEIQESTSVKEAEESAENPAQVSEASLDPIPPDVPDVQANSEVAPPETIQDSSEKSPATSQAVSEKPRRKPQSEIQSSFNLRRR